MARRRKFSDEFRREAVGLATQSGVTKSQIDRSLRIVNRICNGKARGNRSGAIEPAPRLRLGAGS